MRSLRAFTKSSQRSIMESSLVILPRNGKLDRIEQHFLSERLSKKSHRTVAHSPFDRLPVAMRRHEYHGY
jgi:hypothetical protein